MSLLNKPDDGWARDFNPFFWNGEYHLFYLMPDAPWLTSDHLDPTAETVALRDLLRSLL